MTIVAARSSPASARRRGGEYGPDGAETPADGGGLTPVSLPASYVRSRAKGHPAPGIPVNPALRRVRLIVLADRGAQLDASSFQRREQSFGVPDPVFDLNLAHCASASVDPHQLTGRHPATGGQPPATDSPEQQTPTAAGNVADHQAPAGQFRDHGR